VGWEGVPAPRRLAHASVHASVLASVLALACAAVVRGFDAAYHALRALAAIPADSLLHYHWILTWWNHGDSVRGFTLTPSPYFIDLAIQLPIALLAPDFEVFSYVMALVFALLIFASLGAALRIATTEDSTPAPTTAATALAALATIVFYVKAPFGLVLHPFTYNHTSEVYSTLAVLTLLWALFRRGAPRRRYAPAVYALAVAACVVSSPFFIATYCVPVSFAVAALLGTAEVDRRRLAWFLGLTAASALAGLVALALLSRYAWPIRNDHYPLTPGESWERLVSTLRTSPTMLPRAASLWHITLLAMIGATASIVLAVLARRARKLGAAFLLAFFPAALASCVLLPLKRGGFSSAYELRYLQLPWLLAAAFYVATATYVIRTLAARLLRGRRLPAAPRWLPWSAGVLGAGALALVITARGPLSMFDAASSTSPAVSCLASAERDAGLQDGLATAWLARYLNAARGSPAWRSPYVVVQVAPSRVPWLEAHETNPVWFDGVYRGGRAQLNFLATHAVPDDVLAAWRELFGAPDRTITCTTPLDMRHDGKATFDLWIWDRQDARQRLADFVTHDNMRSPFAPVIGAVSMVIDPVWGTSNLPGQGDVAGGRRVWRRGVHPPSEDIDGFRAGPMWVPSGRYRLDIDLSAVPRTDSGRDPQLAQVVVHGGTAPRKDLWIEAGKTRGTIELNVRNRGGPTSGDLLWIQVYPRDVESFELTGMTLTLLEQRRVDPFRIFR
jgi:hypothetical protein